MSARVSTLGASHPLNAQAMSVQAALAAATKELSSGKRADQALALGGQASRAVTLAGQIAALDALETSDALAATRLTVVDQSLGELAEGAQALRNALVGARQSPQERSGLIASAQALMQQFVAATGREVAGVALFGGQNLDAPAIVRYDVNDPASPASAIVAAFQGAFGVAPDDPGVSSIARQDLEAFLDGAFAGQFSAASWAANWSRATDAPFSAQVAPGESVATNASANDPALRDLARAAAMIGDLGAANMSEDAFGVLVDAAFSAITSSLDGLTQTRARLGAAQSRIEDSREAMKATRAALKTQLSADVDVDPLETAAKISALETRLEASFAVTARLNALSLLNYL